MRGGSDAGRTARWIGISAFLLYVLTGGGRIVGSDEVTMLELARAMLHGRIEVGEGATLEGGNSRFYTKNAAGQAVLALPVVAVGEAVASASGLAPERRMLAVRFVASFFNAAVTAILLGFFYLAVRGLGVLPGPSLAATMLLGFTTPLWVYAKSFMAEPLEALGLLLAAAGAARAGAGRWHWIAALGVLIAGSAKATMLPFLALVLLPLVGRPRRLGIPVLGALAVTLAGHLAYDLARFGNPFETGYGRQATAAAYTTPFHVGLYGLLLSPGKGAVWFAPALWLAGAGWRRMRASGAQARVASTWIAVACAAALALYSVFEHWAGDGSFGPRYLVPFLPLAFVPVAFAFERATAMRRRIAWVLGLAGLLVQIGGVSIYFGAQMREAGDYPYTLPLNDPRFMSDSHFNPRFSPIFDHWRMLSRNLGEHLSRQAPRLGAGGKADPRTGLSAAEQRALLHGLDFWWLYLGYAGLPRAPVWIALLALVALLVWSARRLRGTLTAESAEVAPAGAPARVVEAGAR